MIGEKIAVIRVCRGFSQEFMADKLGIKQPTYSSYETTDKLSDDTIIRIAGILGVSVEDITNPNPIFMSFHDHSHLNDPNCNAQETIAKLLNIIEKQQEQLQLMNHKILSLVESQISIQDR
jgi:transcriptional regulator with XRE-family HTH domain